MIAHKIPGESYHKFYVLGVRLCKHYISDLTAYSGTGVFGRHGKDFSRFYYDPVPMSNFQKTTAIHGHMDFDLAVYESLRYGNFGYSMFYSIIYHDMLKNYDATYAQELLDIVRLSPS